MTSGRLADGVPDEDEPLTHFFHCWRFPDHHRCAVELIERQARENDQLLGRAYSAERALRDTQKAPRTSLLRKGASGEPAPLGG